MLTILKMLKAEKSSMKALPEDLTGDDLTFYKHAHQSHLQASKAVFLGTKTYWLIIGVHSIKKISIKRKKRHLLCIAIIYQVRIKVILKIS